MSSESTSGSRIDQAQQVEALYSQLAQSAARLMVIHEAGRILSSTHDREELAQGLLEVIGEAVFAGTGCVIAVDGEELSILATRGLDEHEIDDLAGSEAEAHAWFLVVDDVEPRTREQLRSDLDLEDVSEEEDESDDATEIEAPEDEGDETIGHVEDDTDDWDPEEHENADDDDAHEDQWADDESDEDSPSQLRVPFFELYFPLAVEDEILGLLALGPRVDGRSYTEEDQGVGRSLSSHLGLALKSASLLNEKNKRIEELSVLLQISREITSTLDLDRVLNTIVQMLGMVVPNRRATIALATGSGVSLRASSEPDFDIKAAKSDPLLTVLHWVHGAHQPLNTCRAELEQDPDAEGHDVLLPILSREDGPRGLAVLTLQDDQGVVGLLGLESDEDEPPLDDDHDELVTILANQTTVAIRNAELYQRVPMIGVLEPMLGKAKQAADMGTRRKRIRLGVIAALIIGGFVIPTPTWVSGDAELRPATPVAVRAPTEGTIREVLVDEGQRVSAGTVLGRIQDDVVRVELERTRSTTQRLRAEAARARSEHDLATYRAREGALREHAERERFLETELERTVLTAPVDGVVLTSHVELRQGEHLDIGATLLELADLTLMHAEVHVSENDIHAIDPGSSVRVKVHAHPGRTFRGEVARIATRADSHGQFLVTVGIDNTDDALRPGMTGRAHIESPSRPLFARMFGPLIRGLRLRLWM